jgi:HEPN domain-containing protein
MSYAARLMATKETVRDQMESADHRLDESQTLMLEGKYHIGIYVAGLAAEMYLKTACFLVTGAADSDEIELLLRSTRQGATLPVPQGFKHNLLFWHEELVYRRMKAGLASVPTALKNVVADLCADWFNEMRYRPGNATEQEALRALENVEYIAKQHSCLRS